MCIVSWGTRKSHSKCDKNVCLDFFSHFSSAVISLRISYWRVCVCVCGGNGDDAYSVCLFLLLVTYGLFCASFALNLSVDRVCCMCIHCIFISTELQQMLFHFLFALLFNPVWFGRSAMEFIWLFLYCSYDSRANIWTLQTNRSESTH